MKRLLTLTLACAAALPNVHAAAPSEFSAAEQALFVTNHLAALKPATTLHYRFRKSGSLEAGFDDTATITLSAQPDGKCCATRAEFLSGARRLPLPEIEAAQGNPAILAFLERDIREMERLTKGKANYFREAHPHRRGRSGDDPRRVAALPGPQRRRQGDQHQPLCRRPAARPLREPDRQAKYVFTLSDAVPGGVLSIRTQVDAAAAGTPPLLAEEMALDRQAPTIKP